MPLFVCKVGQAEYRFHDGEQSYGNHWELREYDSLEEAEEAIWEEQCELASDSDDREEVWTCKDCNHEQDYAGDCEECESSNLEQDYEEDWSDYVERVTDGAAYPYDVTNQAHHTLPGFEDERPEHVEYMRLLKEWTLIRKVNKLKTRKQRLLEELSAIDAELEQLK